MDIARYPLAEQYSTAVNHHDKLSPIRMISLDNISELLDIGELIVADYYVSTTIFTLLGYQLTDCALLSVSTIPFIRSF